MRPSRAWGNILLEPSSVDSCIYTASNVGDTGAAKHYIYTIIEYPSGTDGYYIYRASKTIIEEGVRFELLPCVKGQECYGINSIHPHERDPSHLAFRVTTKKQYIRLATHGSMSMLGGANPVSTHTTRLLWRFMCSYRFDILEYLSELGIVIPK